MIIPTELILAATPAVGLLLAAALVVRRRQELRAFDRSARAREEARERGSHAARLQHPDIDLAKCIGCGSCVQACPEDGVLDLLHGQAVVVHGGRCVGHGRCAEACPTGAIALTLADLEARRDIPALTADLEAVGAPGLFVAGELSGFALVRTAVSQGTLVADAVHARLASDRRGSLAASGTSPAHAARTPALAMAPAGGSPAGVPDGPVPGSGSGAASATVASEDAGEPEDLLIVGAGPAGLACALRAKELGISARAVDQAIEIGGTVASYPRRKLVMTQPMHLPLHGRLPKLSYEKEQLVELWREVARSNDLRIQGGVRLDAVHRGANGVFEAQVTVEGLAGASGGTTQTIRARHVCLALGRRGSPRRLDVPGEHLPKVAYSLLDAQSYLGRRILVVGGGDSAVEAAVALSRQPGNEVTLSYRRPALFRIKARNEVAVAEAVADGHLRLQLPSEVAAIDPDSVRLRVPSEEDGAVQHEMELVNDEVFIFAGGDPPFALLERAGVSFDPSDRPAAPVALDRGNGLLVGIAVALASAVVVLAWALWHADYYTLGAAGRAMAQAHDLLRPAGRVGISLGIGAVALMGCNLAYLLRRSRFGGVLPGSLRAWMAVHLATGLFAFLAVLVHAGFSLGSTVGGHALLALTVVVCAGAIGRYLYAFVPRAANGSELDLDSVREQLTVLSGEWDRDARGFGMRVRETIEALTARRWRSGLLQRIGAVVSGEWRLRRTLHGLLEEGRRTGVPEDELQRISALARRAHRLAMQVAHYEEVRAILAGWRYLHRWLSLLMILLACLHIGSAVRYASIDWPFLSAPSAAGADSREPAADEPVPDGPASDARAPETAS